MPRKKNKEKPKRTPEEQAQIDANRCNRGAVIGRWKEENMKAAFDW